MSALTRYHEYLRTFPPSGGCGCHSALMSAANLGVLASIPPEQIFRDLRAAVHGTRTVPDEEIWQAIRKASESDFRKDRKPSVLPRINGVAARNEIISAGAGATLESILSASAVRIDWPFEEDSWRLLECLFQPDEYVFIGDDAMPGRIDDSIRTAAQWADGFKQHGASPWPKIMPNPLTGALGQTKTGRLSYRADACVAAFRFVVCEFDCIPIEQQIAFWCGVNLPVAAIIHSGKKSLHAWVRVDCANAEEWEREVERKLFPSLLEPLGLDRQCKNESRLSRMPGQIRLETGMPQHLLYLAPEGRAVRA